MSCSAAVFIALGVPSFTDILDKSCSQVFKALLL